MGVAKEVNQRLLHMRLTKQCVQRAKKLAVHIFKESCLS